MKENNYKVYITKEFPGYFLNYTGKNLEEFKTGVSDMMDHLIVLAKKKKSEGYKVYFNPTGGFKARVIACSLAGFMSYCEVYYLNEEFDDLVIFPPLFYLPKAKEIELLKILKEQNELSKNNIDELAKKYSEEFERLKNFGFIDHQTSDDQDFNKVRITSRGLAILTDLLNK